MPRAFVHRSGDQSCWAADLGEMIELDYVYSVNNLEKPRCQQETSQWIEKLTGDVL